MKRILISLLLLLLLSWLAVAWIIKLEHQPNYKGMSPAEQAAAETMKPEYAPIENQTPKYFMTISGKVDPGLLKNLSAENVTAIYKTTNEACMYDASGGFEGVMTYRTKKFHYLIKPDVKNGNFSVKVPLDNVLPGYCKWQISTMHYMFSYVADNAVPESPDIIIAFFNANSVVSHNKGVDKWSCGHKFCKQVVSKSIGKSEETDLSLDRNYIFHIYFIKKESNDGNYT